MSSRTMLSIAGWITVLSGVALAVVSFSPEHLDALIALAIPGAAHAGPGAGLLAGISGGLTVGYGVLLLVASRSRGAALQSFVPAAAAAFVSWFVVDSAASLAHGSMRNVISNVLFLVVLLVPLLLARRVDRSPRDEAA